MPTILKIYTFDENGFAKTVIAPACTKYQVSYADVDKEGSGRNPLTGEMYRERIGSYIKLDLTWDLIPGTTEYQNWYKTLTSLPKSFEAEYLDPSSNELVKKRFYRTDIQTELYLFVDENCNIWRGLSTSFVQNDVSSFSWEGVSRKILYLGKKIGFGTEVTTTNKQSFSNLDLIKRSETKGIEEYNKEFYEPTYSNYFITCEEKRVKLDGTFKFLDKSYSTTDGVKNSPIFWWTTWMCNKDTGEFNSHPRLVIKGSPRLPIFEDYYTIVFSEIATDFKIECYIENDNNEEVLDRTISVENNTEKEYIFETLKKYDKFIIEIIKIDNSVVFEGETQKYKRFAKVNTIYRGVFKNLNETITDYEITQEFSADNSEFNSNVLSLKLRDVNNEYDPQNGNNKLNYFKTLPISVDVYVKDRDSDKDGNEVITNPLVKTFKFNSKNNTYNWENQVLSVTSYSDTYNLVYANEDETPRFGNNAKTLSGWLSFLNSKSGATVYNQIYFKDLDRGDILKEDYTNNAITLKGYIPNQSSYNEALRMLVEASYASQRNTTTGQYRNKMVLIDYNEQQLLFKTQLLENNLKFYGYQTIVSDRFVDNVFKITRNYIFEESFQEAKQKNYTVKIYTYQNVQEVTGKDEKGNDIVTTKIETTTYDRTYNNGNYETETIDNPFITSDFMEDPVNWSKETSTIADRLNGYRQHIDSLNTFNFKTNFNGGIIEPGHTYLYESKYGNTKEVVITKVILNGTSFAEVEAKEIREVQS